MRIGEASQVGGEQGGRSQHINRTGTIASLSHGDLELPCSMEPKPLPCARQRGGSGGTSVGPESDRCSTPTWPNRGTNIDSSGIYVRTPSRDQDWPLDCGGASCRKTQKQEINRMGYSIASSVRSWCGFEVEPYGNVANEVLLTPHHQRSCLRIVPISTGRVGISRAGGGEG